MTDLIEVKTARLIGAPLDWAVAMAEGYKQDAEDPHAIISPRGVFTSVTIRGAANGFGFRPSTSWEHGGPLIDKHHGSTQHCPGLSEEVQYSGGPGLAGIWCYGPTALVAFCRGFVHYKLGDTVQVPKELMP
ncbi:MULTISPECIES: DUF2591 domain-containing protein [Pseudomonas]|uniref:DUF2591 domain-containing protein n=1 Tax=Pseudomonas TaxID=286 RepID=UPI0021F6F7E5|nr:MULTISPECIES: DUF2591 domain-containing protein [Pseudomonas]MDS9590720.1 DUF2591 domain-containing protein [Pseudomonas sp. HTZ1]UYP80777.1 DUF2591 domain-containing protein [Pseudomonas asiatica]